MRDMSAQPFLSHRADDPSFFEAAAAVEPSLFEVATAFPVMVSVVEVLAEPRLTWLPFQKRHMLALILQALAILAEAPTHQEISPASHSPHPSTTHFHPLVSSQSE